VRAEKKTSLKPDKKTDTRGHKRGVEGYSKKTALLEDAITQMNAGKYGRSSAALKELLALDPQNMEARRLFATLHLRLGSLIPARQAFDALIEEAFQRQDYWLAESLLREYLAVGPRCVPFLEKLGAVYQQKGSTVEAVVEFGKAVEILIEDPDTDNPQHASQLFAKIRELAPASPVAFRLASFFNAQTGEVIARPAAAQAPAVVEAPSSAVDEHSVQNESSLEQTGGVMPWALSTGSQEVPQPSLTAESTSQVESQALSPISESGGLAVQDLAVESSAATEESDRISANSDGMPEPSVPAPPINQEMTPEVVSTPVPWEEGREVDISAPVEASDASSGFSSDNDTVRIIPSFGIEPLPSGQGEPSDEIPVPLAFLKTTQITPTKEVPVSTSTEPVPDQSAALSLHESSDGSGMSWESVIGTASKFGDELSLTTLQPEAGSTGQPTAAPVAAPMPWDQVQESAIAIPPAPAEEAETIHFRDESAPSADPVEPTLALNLEPILEQTLAEPQQAPLHDQLGTGAVSTAQASPAPPIFESELRLAEDNPTLSVLGAQPTEGEEAAVVPSASIGHPVTEIDLEPPSFTIADSAPTASEPVFQQHEQVDEPVTAALSFSDHLSAPSIEVAPTDHQPESIAAPAKDWSLDPAPSAAVVSEPLAESAQVPPQHHGDPSDWKTGEVAVQSHRTSTEKRRETVEPEPETLAASPFSEPTVQLKTEQPEQQEPIFTEARTEIPEPVFEPKQESVSHTGETLRFIDEPQKSSVMEAAPAVYGWRESGVSEAAASAASAVDVLFEPVDQATRTGARERMAESTPRHIARAKGPSTLHRIGTDLSSFISSCFSTTRAMVRSVVALAVLSCALVLMGVGGIGLTWIIMEKQPSPVFKSLTASPTRMLSDMRKNGYLLLLGFDVSVEQDPIQAGYERKPDLKDGNMALACFNGSGNAAQGGTNASATVAAKWFRAPDPAGRFLLHEDTIKGWVSQGGPALTRYKQWQKLSFEDWGYGQTISPPCASIVFAHQLFLADGFVQGMDLGVERLEADMQAWRSALGQAKTLPVKMLALQALNDDIAVASGLLVRQDFDAQYLGRLTKMLRPFDQVELSIRWPMQSELVSAAKTFDARLKVEREEDLPLHAAVAAVLPLPKQRRLNEYADYYEASYKAAGEGRYGSLPKWKNYIHSPADSVMAYLTNPIENIVGLDPLAAWDLYNGFVVDTDAHLRLASLQAWLRRGPQDAELMVRLAKAGQSFYDPYTGMPMLVSLKKGVLYSVGHDGKDQDADPQFDVVVTIPGVQTSTLQATSFSDSSASK
jgi:hypothetical protein